MDKKKYYSSGEFAKMAQVTIRTIRWYDKQNILKPTYVDEKGKRYYTDSDFALLQQILLFKYLGFALDEIKEMLITEPDSHFLKNSLIQQKRLIQDKIEQMHLVNETIDQTIDRLDADNSMDWNQMLELIHLTGMEKSLKSQYQNASNISARIKLHKYYSVNNQGWFPWIFETVLSKYPYGENVSILDVGCGDGALWTENKDSLEKYTNFHITLTDISDGMIRDARRNVGPIDSRFSFRTCDCQDLPFDDNTFDIIFANHLLFYCDDIDKACSELKRVLKKDGILCCSTYGERHMKEITSLVQEFDSRILLAAENLYDRFGLDNGDDILSKYFDPIELKRYKDEIRLNQSTPLIEYIMSCHGNQNQYLLDRFRDFRIFVDSKVGDNFRITKDAGLFLCRK